MKRAASAGTVVYAMAIRADVDAAATPAAAVQPAERDAALLEAGVIPVLRDAILVLPGCEFAALREGLGAAL